MQTATKILCFQELYENSGGESVLGVLRSILSAQIKVRWAPPSPRLSGAHPGLPPRRAQLPLPHVASRQIVSRIGLEIREENGLLPDSLDGLVAGRIRTFLGCRLAPWSLLGEGTAVDTSLVDAPMPI